MIERKNIDRLFQEKFKDFEVAPSEQIWEHIEAELKEKKKRRAIPFWFRLSGIAAALLIGLFISYRLMNWNSEGKPEQKIVLDDKNNSTPKSIGTENQNNTNTGNKQNNIQSPGAITLDKNSAVTASEAQDKVGGNEPNSNHSDVTNQNAGENPSQNKKLAFPKMANSNQSVVVSETKTNKKSHSERNKAIGTQHEIVKSNAENAVAAFGNKNNPNHAVVQQSGNNNENKLPSNLNSEKAGAPLDKNSNPANTAIANHIIENKPTDSKSNPIAENPADKKIDTTAIATVVPNALEELLNEKENKVTTKEPKLNRWQVASSVAPIYFSSTSNGSPLDSRFESNKKSYKPTVSYGLGIQYALNKKLAVRSGVSAVKLEYNTSDLVFFQTTNARQIQNVNSNIQGAALQIDNKPTELNMAARAGGNKFDATLNQKTGYIEVPVELSYKLIDKKFGVELIGGISTLFLNQNEVILQTPGLEMNIGEANNLNDLHFSTNVGVGVKYNFLKSFQANFEPMFKYQMNTFSNDAGNFKPYFFGFYTGVSYRF